MTATNPARMEADAALPAAAPAGPGPGEAPPQPDHSAAQALRNIVTGYGALFISSLSNIVLTPIMLRTLGQTDYGILRVSSQLFSYVGLLDFGVSTSMIYFVARYHSTGDRAALNRYVSTIFNAILFLGLLCIVAPFFGASAVTSFIGVPASSEATATWVIRLSGLLFAAHFVGGIFGGILVGRGRFDINNLITTGYFAFNAIGTFIILSLGYGVVPVVAFNALAALVGAGARAFWSGPLGLAKVRVGRISLDVLRNAMGYGFWSFLNNVASQLSFATTDMLILARLLGVSSVAVYSVALAPVGLVTALVFECTDVFQPTITNMAYRKDGDEADVARAFLLLAKTSILLGWGLVLMLWLVGRPLLVFWVGEIGQSAGDLLIALTFAYGWNFLGHASGLVLLGIAKHRLLGIVSSVGAAVNVVLSVVFALRFGLLGVAFGTIIVMGVTEMLILPIYTCRQVGLPVRSYLLLLARTALSLLVAYVAGFAAGDALTLALGVVPGLIGAAATGAVVFLAAFWLLLLTPEERGLVVGVARGLLRRRPPVEPGGAVDVDADADVDTERMSRG